MKKLIALLCAVVLAMSTMITSFAAPSVTADIVSKVEQATDENNEAVNVVTNKITKEDHKQAIKEIQEQIKTEEGMEEVIGKDYKKGMKPVSVREVTLVDETGKELTAEEKEEVEWPVKIVFEVKGVKPDSKVVLLHYNGEKWEVVESIPGEGTVTGVFYSLSPVMFVVDNDTAETIADIKAEMGGTASDELLGGTTSDDTSKDDSPKTGDNNATWMYGALMVVAVVAVGGVVVSKKRS